jgi:hypothetical protein
MNIDLWKCFKWLDDEIDIYPVIFSLETAECEFDRLNHIIELIGAELKHLRKKLKKTGAGHKMANIHAEIEDLAENSKKIFIERECLLMCVNFVASLNEKNFLLN